MAFQPNFVGFVPPYLPPQSQFPSHFFFPFPFHITAILLVLFSIPITYPCHNPFLLLWFLLILGYI